MSDTKKVSVAVKGYGVISKRVAAAVVSQPDMTLAGVSDVVTDVTEPATLTWQVAASRAPSCPSPECC